MQGAWDIRTNRIITALLLATLFATGCLRDHAATHPAAIAGSIDLSKWNPGTDGVIKLNGEWLFFPDTLLDNAAIPAEGLHATVPGQWKTIPGYGNKHAQPDFGYGTYVLTVKGIPRTTPAPLIVTLHEIRSAYSLFVQPLGPKASPGHSISVGKIGTNKESAIPQFLPRTLTFPTTSDSCRLTLQVSNFSVTHGGIKSAIELGESYLILRDRDTEQALLAMIIGIILFMAIHHIALSVTMRRRSHYLIFGLFGIVMCAHAILKSWRPYDWFTEPNPVVFDLLLRSVYCIIALAGPLFLAFFTSIFPREFHKRAVHVTWAISILFLLMLPLPLHQFEHIFQYYLDLILVLYLYAAINLIRAIRHNREGALAASIGNALFFCAVLNDVLYDHHVIYTAWLSSYGLVAFFFCQSIMLSLQYAKAHRDAEYLTHNLEFEVKRKTEELNALYDELVDAEKYKSIAVLTSSISHEILNPLMGIDGPLKIIHKEIPEAAQSAKLNKALAFIDRNIKRIRHSVETLRSLSRSTIDTADSVHLQDLAAPIIELMKERLPPGVKLLSDIPDSLHITTNSGALSQILINLLTNAIEAVGNSGEVRLSLSQNQAETIIAVSDTGCGIVESDRSRIFDFAYTTKGPSQGTGIGLFIVKNLAEKIGAEVRVRSVLNEGTVFEIVFKR